MWVDTSGESKWAGFTIPRRRRKKGRKEGNTNNNKK
jgi:hypothetical protein